ncbi:hypothetical protein C5S30_04405 [ANME-1 cluster archaeon GoMg4]|nr:hypothetical protein [ANME-1 cluster archaeon GoMg4]
MKEQFCILIASSRTCSIDCGKEDTKHVTRLNKDYAVLVGGRCGTAEWIRAMGLQIGTILADRKLFIQSRCDFYLFTTSIAFGSPGGTPVSFGRSVRNSMISEVLFYLRTLSTVFLHLMFGMKTLLGRSCGNRG